MQEKILREAPPAFQYFYIIHVQAHISSSFFSSNAHKFVMIDETEIDVISFTVFVHVRKW